MGLYGQGKVSASKSHVAVKKDLQVHKLMEINHEPEAPITAFVEIGSRKWGEVYYFLSALV